MACCRACTPRLRRVRDGIMLGRLSMGIRAERERDAVYGSSLLECAPVGRRQRCCELFLWTVWLRSVR